MRGVLYIVSTPIGNLEDITLRALRILKEVDVIAAEDTRHSAKLLNHYGIKKPVISYWEEKEKVRSEEIIKRLQSGQSIALISDAGTPGISDPGEVVIRKALDEKFDVIPVPGPSALIAALSVSGLPLREFTFIGFLPSKGTQRQKVLQELSMERRTLVFYEAPHRIIETLQDMHDIFGNRNAAVFKELTKIHEEVFRGPLEKVISEVKGSKVAGEFVIVIEGRGKEGGSIEDALKEVLTLIKRGTSRKDAVRMVADTYGLSKRELYERSLKRVTRYE
ncbi:MAG: 16S rRNA (cytidine(1402)-2'-O)-methyltransferase [Thermodesulfovibrionales bacterium]